MADALIAIIVAGVVGFVLGVAVGRHHWTVWGAHVPGPTPLALKRAGVVMDRMKGRT